MKQWPCLTTARKCVNSAYKALVVAALSCSVAQAVQTFDIVLHDKQGEVQVLGTLDLRPNAAGDHFSINWDAARFDDHFLSMRPFKCLQHPAQLVCHMAYPYEIKQVITADDLTDLEYSMLFLHKSPQEYGINAWNGLYFEFQRTADGFVGELRETDLNVLQAPPDDGNLRPIAREELHEASDKHWLRRITLKPQNQ